MEFRVPGGVGVWLCVGVLILSACSDGPGASPASAGLGGTDPSGGAAGSSQGGGSGASGASTGGASTGGGAQGGAGGQGGGVAGASGSAGQTGGWGAIDPVSGCRSVVLEGTLNYGRPVVEDLDGNGYSDVVFSRAAAPFMSEWALAMGSETGLSAPVAQPLTPLPDFIAIGDFDGDAADDLLFSGQGGTEVWLSDGAGTFTPTAAGPTTGSRGALVADADGDGDLDVLDPEQAIRVYAGNGDGTFAATSYDAYVLPISQSLSDEIQAADLDGDGDVDLVVPWIVVGSGGVDVLSNDGTGQFSQTDFFAVDPTASVIFDLNDDSNLDVAVAADVTNQVHVWLGDGAGLFEGVTGLLPTAGEWPAYLAAGDLDGDGTADLVTGNMDSRDLSVLSGNGDGTFQMEQRIDLENLFPVSVVVARVDPDDNADILVGTTEGLRIYFGPCPL